ncbi:MAG TPA: hypothetical protein VFR85_08980 [Anaeromyxobacteraceae bacterium]|nr:hypothetical protein [Anaeromyxobacteraceae bacterium]
MNGSAGPVVVDAAAVRLTSSAEIDSAIDTVLTFAFGHAERLDTHYAGIRASLSSQPSVLELVEAVFAARRASGPIADEPTRRADAAMAMAAFLSADPHDLGLEGAFFRVGGEFWLTPARLRPD